MINSTSGVIKVKSYAYNDVANQSINAGQGNLGTNEVALDSKFVIYPNPTKDIFSIIGNGAINAIEIYDSVGKLVFSRQNPNNEINIDFLSKGFYISLLKSDNNTSVVKLIKE